MKKVLILGATGMAGNVVFRYFTELRKYQVFTACFRKKIDDQSFILDVRNEANLEKIIAEVRPDYVINCVGILIRGSKDDSENCIFINAYYPHLLSRLIHTVVPESRLVHISTDCVFSGSRGMYSDTDVKDALDVYGMSKNLGEIINDRDVTIRTSIIGPELKEAGEGLFHWLFTQRNKKLVNGYQKNIWGGVTTLELAKAIDFCIDNDITGLYQISNGSAISKFDLLNEIAQQFALDICVQPIPGLAIDKSIQPSAFKGITYKVPSYHEMIAELNVFMKKHSEQYAFYLR